MMIPRTSFIHHCIQLVCLYVFWGNRINYDQQSGTTGYDSRKSISSSTLLVVSASNIATSNINTDKDEDDGFQNNEIMERFMERIAAFMSIPLNALDRIAEYLQRGGFPNDLKAPDRDFAVKFLSVENVSDIYYGLEDGTYVYYNDVTRLMNYREPGNDGYDAYNIPQNMQKHFVSCLDPVNITFRECIMEPGMEYIHCPLNENKTCNSNALVQCSNNNNINSSQSQSESKATGHLSTETDSEVKWCQDYTIKDVTEDDGQGKKLGYVPFTTYCLNARREVSQIPGEVVTQNKSNCMYGSELKEMPNELLLGGDYEYCGGNGVRCNNTFVGGFWSGQYDPRLRTWYKQVRAEQQPLWTEPYPYQGGNNLGLTYAKPIYNVAVTNTGEKKFVFAGVLAVDYELSYVINLLIRDYGNTSTDRNVMIAEDKEPHYIIAASTGSPSVRRVFIDDEDRQCSVDGFEYYNCKTIRQPMDKFDNSSDDRLLQRVFMEHKRLGFPKETVRVKESDKIGAKAYMSKGDLYMPTDAKHLKWRTFVVLPMKRSTVDASMPKDLSFTIVIVLGTIGFVGCASMLAVFFSKRGENAIVYSDWRFTCAFLLGCTVLNLSSFTLLGENKSEMCMLRMWSFNFLFVCALSPLFVKVWRMSKLQRASAGFRRVNITHTTAFLYTLPTILVEVLILTVFSFYDPPHQVELLGSEEGPEYQEVTCQTETDSFFITQLVFNGILVLVGCILAFQTRNIDPRFGEAKQLGFCMYNIAFTGITLVTVNRMLATDQESRIVIQACGVFWGTLFSCFAFSMPRLLEAATGRLLLSAQRFTLLPSNSGRFAVLVPNDTSSRLTIDSATLGSRGFRSGSIQNQSYISNNNEQQRDSKPVVAPKSEEIIFECSHEDTTGHGEPEHSLYFSNICDNQVDENIEKNILAIVGLKDT